MTTDNEVSVESEEAEKRMDNEQVAPPFIQIVTAVSNAFGRADDQEMSSDVLYGLTANGRVWLWTFSDPERKGSKDGWELLTNAVYNDGAPPPVVRKTR
jgi:hypothetical protein